MIASAAGTITAATDTKVYDVARPGAALQVDPEDLAADRLEVDVPPADPTFATTATATSPVASGGYRITASGAVDPNYTISYAAGTITVTPATPRISSWRPAGPSAAARSRPRSP